MQQKYQGLRAVLAVAVVVFLSPLLVTACTSYEEIYSPRLEVMPGLERREMRFVLMESARSLNWFIDDRTPNLIKARKSDGENMVEIEIAYNAEHYNIRYRNSAHMQVSSHDRSVATVDATYNDWIRELEAKINETVAQLHQQKLEAQQKR